MVIWLYSYTITVIWLYSYTVVWLNGYSFTVIQLYSYTVIQSYSYTVIPLYSCPLPEPTNLSLLYTTKCNQYKEKQPTQPPARHSQTTWILTCRLHSTVLSMYIGRTCLDKRLFIDTQTMMRYFIE